MEVMGSSKSAKYKLMGLRGAWFIAALTMAATSAPQSFGYDTYRWYANGVSQGGSGTWDQYDETWYTEYNFQAQWEDNPTDAVFGGTAGTVNISGFLYYVTVGAGIEFNTSGYTLEGDPIALEGGSIVVNANATIDSDLVDGFSHSNSLSLGRGLGVGGILTLGGTNTYSGTTTIIDGNLKLANNGAIPDTSAVTLESNSTLNVNGYDSEIGSLSSDSSSNQVLLGSGVLYLGNDNTSTTYSGTISGTGIIAKIGTGYFTLSGSNSYSGETFIGGGRVIVTENSNLGGSSAPIEMYGGILEVDGTGFTMSRDVYLDAGGGGFYVPSGELTINDAISGTGLLQITGDGAVALTTENSYSGETDVISGGTLIISDDNELGDSANIVLNDGALEFGAAATISSDRAIYVGSSLGAISTNGYNAEIDATINDIPSQAGVFVKLGDGILTLTGTNEYTGGTIIDGGTLAISSDAAINSGMGGIAFYSGTLQFNNYTSSLTFSGIANLNLGAATGDASTLSNGISGSYGLTYSGPGTLILTGANTYTGDTTVSAGTLKYDITSGSVSVTNGATVTIDSVAAIIAGGTVDPFSSVSGSTTNRVNIVNDSSTGGGGGFSVTAGTKNIGTLTGTGDTVVGVTGGSATLDVGTFSQNSMTLTGNGIVKVRKRPGSTPQVNTLSSLSIDYTNGATLALRDNALVINYGSNSNPITDIQQYIQSGSDSGVWDGTGITGASRTACALGYANVGRATYPEDITGGTGTWLGSSVPSTSVVVVFTWLGDCNLDGKVDSSDLALMGSGPADDWYHGDLNYDGVVDADDFSLFDLGVEFYDFDGAWPSDLTVGDAALRGRSILASAEAEFNGESNAEIKSQLEGQMGSAAMITLAPEPTLLAVTLFLPLLVTRRRRRYILRHL
jgi:fibronectin-binding autotransporter adhesin